MLTTPSYITPTTAFDFIENTLNDELDNIAKYMKQNELIINLKKGKTESMIFGSGKKLSKVNDLDLKLRGTSINPTKRYKYLGTILDPVLNLNYNFDTIYKKASSRIRLMSFLKRNLTAKAANDIYSMMIVPLLKLNCVTNLNLNKTQLDRITSLDSRAHNIINSIAKKEVYEIPCTINILRSHACVLVRKCLDKNICSNYHDYFQINQTIKTTRNSTTLLKLPKIKLESTRKSFYYMGAKLYNDLPLKISTTENFNIFREKVKKYSF